MPPESLITRDMLRMFSDAPSELLKHDYTLLYMLNVLAAIAAERTVSCIRNLWYNGHKSRCGNTGDPFPRNFPYKIKNILSRRLILYEKIRNYKCMEATVDG